MRSSRPEEVTQENEESVESSSRLLTPSQTNVSKLLKKKQMREPSSNSSWAEEESDAGHFSKISENDDTSSINLSSYARRPLTMARQSNTRFGPGGLNLSFIKTSYYSYFIIVLLSISTIVQTVRLNAATKDVTSQLGDGRKNLRVPNAIVSQYGGSNNETMTNLNSSYADSSNMMFGGSMSNNENGMMSMEQQQDATMTGSMDRNSIGTENTASSNGYASSTSSMSSMNEMMPLGQSQSSSSSYGNVNSANGFSLEQQQNVPQDQTMYSTSATSSNGLPSDGGSTQYGTTNSMQSMSSGMMTSGASSMDQQQSSSLQQPAYGTPNSLSGSTSTMAADSSNTMGMGTTTTATGSNYGVQSQSAYGTSPSYPTGTTGTTTNGMMQSDNQMVTSPTGTTTSTMGSQAYGSNANGMIEQQQQSPTGSYALPATGSNQSPPSGYVDANGQVVDDAQFELPSMELIELSNFKDTWDPRELTDLPVFFRIPYTGADVIEKSMRTCHRFITASEHGIANGHGEKTQLGVVNVIVEGDPIPSRFVNIDTTTSSGVARATQLGFANSNLVDAVITPFIYEANDLLKDNPSLMGRFFATFRHPVERAVIAYEAAKANDPEVAAMTLEQYAASPKVENNYLTRRLSRQFSGDLEEEHVKLALEVIRRKFLVGLGSFPKASITRFERFFTWIYRVNPEKQELCREEIFEAAAADVLVEQGNTPGEGTPAYDLLAFQNQFDLQLYGYIESLWKEQEQFVAGIDEEIRRTEGTCCECDPPTLPPEGFLCPVTASQ